MTSNINKIEKQTSSLIMQQYGSIASFQNLSAIDSIKFQYHVTIGVLTKAINEDFDMNSVAAGVFSTINLCGKMAAHFPDGITNDPNFFKTKLVYLKKKLLELIDANVTDNQKLTLILDCQELTQTVDVVLASSFDQIEIKVTGEIT
jgi:hypothetical protein